MSTLFRYKKWDGSQALKETSEGDCFEEFSKYLMEGWTPDEAYDWILKQGIGSKRDGTFGIDDLRGEISEYKKNIFETYNLSNSLDQIQAMLESLIEKELESLKSQVAQDSEEIKEKIDFLSSLSEKLSQAVESLSEYKFLNPDAEEIYSSLAQMLDDIKSIEKFIGRMGDKFCGEEELGFEETLQIINLLQDLDKIERMMMSGDISEIREEDLKEVLSDKGYDSILVLKNFRSVLEDGGLIKTVGERTELTPKGIRKIGEKTLTDLFSALKRRKLSEHETGLKGSGSSKHEHTKPYEYGDPFDLSIVNTLKNSLSREHTKEVKDKVNIELEPGDFEVYESEYQTHAATVLLLDLSWSMSFQGRFPAAKRVALAMDHLIKTRYARDNFYIIGFSTGARPLTTKELAVTTWDSNDPFTNIQDALASAARTLSKHKNSNKQIILITDGQPTAYKTDGYLQVELPMFFGGLSPRATFETLKEVKRVTAMGIRINTFMLDDSPTLRRFVDEMTRVNKGRAFFTKPGDLGKYLLVDYLKRRKQIL